MKVHNKVCKYPVNTVIMNDNNIIFIEILGIRKDFCIVNSCNMNK